MAATLDVKLKRPSKIFHQDESIKGFVIFESKSECRHEGINISVDGIVNMQLSPKNVGIFEAFYNSVKPITLLNYTVDVLKAGRLPSGKTEIPFELPLTSKIKKTFYETYHGVFITIQYTIRCEMKRPMLTKDLHKSVEFIVEYPKDPSESSPTTGPIFAPSPSNIRPVTFCISPDSLTNVKDKSNIPDFKIKGHLDSSICRITEPLTGELTVEYCKATIRSIELQLVRVETCGCAEGYARDATEIQNIQIAELDVTRGLPIPIFMIFPRLFTCPTIETTNFKIEFEVNLVIVFDDNHLVTENFPIVLIRNKNQPINDTKNVLK